MKRIAVLGSTGFIGTRTLDVIEHSGGELGVAALTAHRNVELFLKQVEKFRPKLCGMTDPEAAKQARGRIPRGIEFVEGAEAATAAAGYSAADTALVAIVGIAGLPAVMAAIRAGHDVALANKEALVTGGALVTEAAREKNVSILPVDSEHSAIFQCLQSAPDREGLEKIYLTCSGGPFRLWEKEKIAAAPAFAALKHPTWKMGNKITIDSSTLMNKGFEIIEAGWLFGVSGDKIEVVVHPQSIVHSMVKLRDKSVLAQLGAADMRIPIQYALRYPARAASPADELDLYSLSPLTFEKPDTDRFPCLNLAREAMKTGGLAPTVLNAANEIAVEEYLNGRISFYGISDLCARMLSLSIAQKKPNEIGDVYEADAFTRRAALDALGR